MNLLYIKQIIKDIKFRIKNEIKMKFLKYSFNIFKDNYLY